MFWEKYYNLCLQKGVSPNAAAKEMKISSGAVTEWKKGRVPQMPTLKKIADYFNVSTEFLLGNEKEGAEASNASFLDTTGVRMIPVYESVSAGFGTVAQNCIAEYMPIYIANAHEASETLCIKVQGNSMSPMIENGDIIQIHKQTSVDSGSLAVVLVDDDDAFVKKIIYGESFVELHSINPQYKPIRFEGADILRVRVVGLVRRIIKNADHTPTIPSSPQQDTDSKLSALMDKLTDEELHELELLVDYIISKRKK